MSAAPRHIPCRTAIFFWAACVWLFPGIVRSETGYPPVGDYFTRETAHFRLHYPKETDALAVRLLRRFESARRVMITLIPWTPSEKTEVFLIDASDDHNGWANVLPRNTIAVFLAATDSDSTILDPGDYLMRTFIHEYTHILTLDMRRGYRMVFSRIFGKNFYIGGDVFSMMVYALIALPTHLLDYGWLVESITVFNETAFSNRGRGRSAYYGMIARMAVIAHAVPPVGRITFFTDQWPYRALPYFYGYQLARYIESHYNRDPPAGLEMGRLFWAGADAVPLFINNGPADVLGKTYSALFRETAAAMIARERPRIAMLQQSGASIPYPYTLLAETIGRPVIDPNDTRYAYVVMKPPDGRRRLYRCGIGASGRDAGTAPRTLRIDGRRYIPGHEPIVTRLNSGDINNLISITKDGRFIYFTREKPYGKTQRFKDLYRYDVRRDRSTRITHGARIRMPCVSPDGKRVAFVRNVLGAQSVWVVSVDALENGLLDDHPNAIIPAGLGRRAVIVVRSPYGTQYYDPMFSHDGKKITYTIADNTGYAIAVYDLNSKKNSILSKGKDTHLMPSFTADDTSVLYVSDKNGVWNVYQLDLSGTGVSGFAVTNVFGGIFYPTDDGRTGTGGGNGFICIACDSRGFYLTKFSNPARRQSSELPMIGGEWDDGLTRPNLVSRAVSDDIAVSAPTPYSPWRYMMPAFWFPALTLTDKVDEYGILTGGIDPMNFMYWIMQIQNGVLTADPDIAGDTNRHDGLTGFIRFRYNRFRGNLTATASRSRIIYADLLEDAVFQRYDYVEFRDDVRLSLNFPWYGTEAVTGFGMTGAFSKWHESHAGSARYDPGTLITDPVFTGDVVRLGLFVYWDSTANFVHSASPEDGWAMRVNVGMDGNGLGGDLNRVVYSGSIDRYQNLNIGGLRNAVLNVHLSGGGGNGDVIPQRSFGTGDVRGYSQNMQTGERVIFFKIAYTVPILNLQKGVGDSPLFFRNVSVEIFHDAAAAFDHAADLTGLSDFIQSDGVELQLNMALADALPATAVLGYARAHDRAAGERDQVYLDLRLSVEL